MKQYVDLKFWKMFSGFVTLLACSVIFLLAVKIHQNQQIESSRNTVSEANSTE